MVCLSFIAAWLVLLPSGDTKHSLSDVRPVLREHSRVFLVLRDDNLLPLRLDEDTRRSLTILIYFCTPPVCSFHSFI